MITGYFLFDSAFKGVNQFVDIFFRHDFGYTVKCALAQLGKFTGNVFAAENFVCQEVFVDFSHCLAGLVKVYDKFFKERGIELNLDALESADFLDGVTGRSA